MSDQTKISWTNSTWNPWMGCHKVSAGCKNCYMFREQKQYGRDPNIVVRSKTKFNDPLKWKDPRMVFTCSWSDWFIPEADAWRASAWDIIKRTPHLTYQILTKRPERIAECLPSDWDAGYPNVWLGVSVENQRAADERIPLLIQTPAAIHFLSCEPLLEPINLFSVDGPVAQRMSEISPREMRFPADCIDWVIVGGESGPNYRPMRLDWARSIRDQCVDSGIAFFFKQESAFHSGTNPKLDGVEWHQFPVVTA